MIAPLSRVMSSIAVQVTAVTVGGFLILVVASALLLQGPFATWVYPRAVSENAPTLIDLVLLLADVSPENERLIVNAFEGQERAARITDDFADHLRRNRQLSEALTEGAALEGRSLQERELRFAYLGPAELSSLGLELQAHLFSPAYAVQIAIALEDGRVLNIWLAPTVALERRPSLLLLIITMIIIFAVSLSASIAFVVNRPIRRLERDAGQIGLANRIGQVAEEGPVELRQLASALNQMRSRLAGLITEREQMIAAIAHDVRTGLTRVRLRLDENETVSAQALEADLSHMEHLIADMVAYARAESPSNPMQLVRMRRFLAEIASSAPIDVTFQTDLDDGEEFIIAGDPVALRRLFENLLENARRYGGNEVALRLYIQAGDLLVMIEDNGPGLPEDQLEAVFKPFHRLEGSRNRATGGSGLGLGIARAIALTHGAMIDLMNRQEGGLCARICFPAELRT